MSAAEIMFYQLEKQPLEVVLPVLLEKTLARGWRAVVKSGDAERLDALDAALWTYSEDSFLPHGTSRDGFAGEQPIFLTTSGENPNGAQVCFLVEGAQPDDSAPYARIVYLFSGRDEAALAQARETWKRVKTAGHPVTYWQQDERGRWEKRA